MRLSYHGRLQSNLTSVEDIMRTTPANEGFKRPFSADIIATVCRNLQEPIEATDCVDGIMKYVNIKALLGLCLIPDWSSFAQESLLRNVQIKSERSATSFLALIQERSELCGIVQQLHVIGRYLCVVEIMGRLTSVRECFLDGVTMLPSFRTVGCEVNPLVTHSISCADDKIPTV